MCENNAESLKALIMQLKAAKTGGLEERNIVLVKENFSLTAEKDILEELQLAGTFSIDVLTFSRLIYKLAKDPMEGEYLTKFGAVMMLSKIITENRNKFLCYKCSAGAVGFSEKVYDLISDLKSAAISPAAFAKVGENAPVRLAGKIHDIALIYTEYEKAVSGRFYDETTKLEILSRLISESDVLANANVYLTDFDGYSKRDFKVIAKLCAKCKNVLFSTVTNREKEVYLNYGYDNVTAMLEDMGIPYEVQECSFDAPAEVRKLRDSLYSYEAAECLPTPNVQIYEAADPYQEVEHLAAVICDGVRKGARFRDFAVLCQDTDGYGLAFSKVFGECGIPFFMAQDLQLSDHPIAKFLLDTMEISVLKQDASQDKFIRLAKNPVCVGNFEDACKFENYCLKFGISRKKFFETFPYESDDREISEAMRQRLISGAQCFQAEDLMKACDYTQALRVLIEDAELIGQVEAYAVSLEETNMQGAEFTRKTLDKVHEILRQIDMIYGQSYLTFEEFGRFLQSGMAGIQVPMIPLGGDCVFVGDCLELKFVRSKELCAVGLNEGVIPQVQKDWGLITAADTLFLNAEGYDLISLEYINKKHRFNAYSALQNFTRKLWLSYSLTAVGGSRRTPSKLVGFVREAFALPVLTESDLLLLPLNEMCAEDYYQIVSEGVISGRYANLKKSEYRAENAEEKQILAASIRAAQAEVSGALEEEDRIEHVPIACGKELFLADGAIGETAIESYFRCPYRYFAERGLGARQRETFGLSVLDIGTYLHRVAELYSARCEEIEFRREASDRLVGAIINEIAKCKEFSAAAKDEVQRVLLRRLQAEANVVCFQILKQLRLGDFKLKHREYAFGGESGIELFGGVRLKGKIDRIDTTGTLARIIDYKTGNVEVNLGDIYTGKSLQLPLYSLQVEKMGLQPVGEFYFKLHNRYTENGEKDYRLDGRLIDSTEVIERMDRNIAEKSDILRVKKDGQSYKTGLKNGYLADRDGYQAVHEYGKLLAGEAVSQIGGGNILPNPIASECDRCPAKDVCGFASENVTPRQSVKIGDYDFFKEAVKVWNGQENKDKR